MTVGPGWWWLSLALGCAACSRSSGSMELLAPFSDDTVVGRITARWTDSGQTRGGDPAAAERRLTFRVDAVNRLSDRLYLRLRHFRLLAADGPREDAEASVECTLAPGATPGVLSGGVWIAAGQATAVRGFHVDYLSVPLSERGRAFYREFLLRQRPNAVPAIDAELAAEAAAPPCRAAD
jgi:hypothetical protein